MPETMIIYRFFFEWLGTNEGIAKAKEKLGHSLDKISVQAWWKCYNECKNSVSSEEWAYVESFIHTNRFDEDCKFENTKVQRLISFYQNNRKSIIEPYSELYLMKCEYDLSPTIALTRRGKKN